MSVILTVLFSATLAVQPTIPPPAKAPGATKTHDRKTAGNAAPDPDLIGFLGDYEDAADGLDPIGLSEQMNDATNAAADQTKKDEKNKDAKKKDAKKKDEKKDGHEP